MSTVSRQYQQPSARRYDSLTAQLQRSLTRKAYDTGEVDGRYGPRTRAAVAAFQHDHLMQPTGAADQHTIAALIGTDSSNEGGGSTPTPPRSTPPHTNLGSPSLPSRASSQGPIEENPNV